MTGILTECTKPIWEKLLNSGIAEARYVCCFKCIAEDFRSEKDDLKKIQDDPLFQQKRVNDLINEDTEIKKTCFFGWCPNCAWQYRRGKELADKTIEIRKLKSDQTIDLTRVTDVDYHSSHNYIPFESRVSKYKELVDALKDENNYVIGLYGMGGTGKTTLVREVGKELKKMEQFDRVIDTTVSNTPDIKKIQDDIATTIGIPRWKECEEAIRPKRLHESLIKSKKTLIILDDVWDWEHIDFEKIGIPYNHKGCRVLLTTRQFCVCQLMNCQSIIQLETLSEKDAWNMFKHYANIVDNPNLKGKGKRITKECIGLPVAIAAIARSLKGQGPAEWDAALKTLQTPMLRYGDVDENKIDIYKCLKYSYDHLKSKQEKELFLICASVEEDREIPFSVLTRYSIGVGLFKETNKYDTSRSQVVIATKKLIDSCLLLPAGKGGVKMHDLVREVALWIADNKTLVVDLSDKKQKELVEREKNIRYLTCSSEDTDIFSCLFDGTNLEILVVNFDSTSESVKVPDTFIEKMASLRVLVLSRGSWWGNISLSLPQSIQLWKCFRSIILCGWKLGDISILGMIQCLETLDLIDCSINEFPTKMAELEKLKLLRLEDCIIEMNNPFEVIERCSSLEELYFVANKVLWLDNVNKAELIHQNRNFPKFQRYHLMDWYGYRDYSIAKCVFVEDIDALISEETCKHLMQCAEILKLQGSKLARRNLVPEVLSMENQGMQGLVELGLESCSEVQCLIDTKNVNSDSQGTFSKLVELQLQSMDNLEEICNGPLPVNLVNKLEMLYIKKCQKLQGILIKSMLNLCNLKIMKVKNCPMLVSLFHFSAAQSLMVLEALKIHKCEGLTNIITNDRIGDQNKGEIVDNDDDMKNRSSMFPKLKTLDIRECHLLEFILPVFSTQDILALEEISINDCRELKYIFGQYNQDQKDQYLHQEVNDVIIASVKKMELFHLPKFSDIFPKYEKSSSKCASKEPKHWSSVKCNILSWTTHKCSYAQKCGHKWRCNKDKKQDCSTSAMTYPINPFTLQNLTIVQIVGCAKLESIFSSSILRCLPQLEVLLIESCIEFKQLIDEDEGKQKSSTPSKPCFPKLRALFVIQCNKLKRLLSISKSEEFPELEILIIKEASELEEVFGCEQSVKKVELPKLKHVVFINLPSLRQGIDLRSRTHDVVHNCPKLHNSPPTRNVDVNELVEQMCDILRDTSYGPEYGWDEELRKLLGEAVTQDTTTESSSDSENGSEAVEASGRDPPFQQGLLDGHSLGEQHSIKDQQQVRETEANSTRISERNNFHKEAEDQSIQEVTKLVDPAETRNISPQTLPVAPLQKNNDRKFEDGTTTKNVKEVTSVPHSIPTCSPSSPLITSQQKTHQLEHVVAPNHPATKYGDGKDPHKASEFVAGPTEAHSLGVMEDPNLISLVKMELEELVASSHLASENLSLLTDFITNKPSVRLTDNAHSNKYKGFAYSCLADLSRFLQTHSALDVLESCRSDFLKLLNDARSLGFNKDWLDAVERRALCPGLEEVSQGQLQKILDTKQQAAKEVEAMRLKIGILTELVEDLKHQLAPSEAALESIIQREAQVLEARAALGTPLGYY